MTLSGQSDRLDLYATLRCRARTVFWPGVEDIAVECNLAPGHAPPHRQALPHGDVDWEWTDDELVTVYPEERP